MPRSIRWLWIGLWLWLLALAPAYAQQITAGSLFQSAPAWVLRGNNIPADVDLDFLHGNYWQVNQSDSITSLITVSRASTAANDNGERYTANDDDLILPHDIPKRQIWAQK